MSYRVLRGGSAFNDSRYLRTTDRNWSESKVRLRLLGFRVVIRRQQ